MRMVKAQLRLANLGGPDRVPTKIAARAYAADEAGTGCRFGAP